MTKARWITMILACVMASLIGIIAGPILQCGTYLWLDPVLPHPNSHQSDMVLFRGVSGAFAMFLPGACGAVWAQFLLIPLTLSFFYPRRAAAHLCAVSAQWFLVWAFCGLLLVLPMVFGMPVIPALFYQMTWLHGILIYLGFPLIAMRVLALRAVFLLRISARRGDI